MHHVLVLREVVHDRDIVGTRQRMPCPATSPYSDLAYVEPVPDLLPAQTSHRFVPFA